MDSSRLPASEGGVGKGAGRTLVSGALKETRILVSVGLLGLLAGRVIIRVIRVIGAIRVIGVVRVIGVLGVIRVRVIRVCA